MNINELLPPAKNIFTFGISGTILVTPRSRLNSRSSSTAQSDTELDPEPIALPRFIVLAADAETTTIVIRNEVENANVEVYNSSGDIRDAQTRKTVLQKGGFTRCGTDGGRIAIRSFRPMPSVRYRTDLTADSGKSHQVRSRTPSRVDSPGVQRQILPAPLRPRRDGPLMIPSVTATVTPLLGENYRILDAYAVRVCLPAPCDSDTEWLEFGFAQNTSAKSLATEQIDRMGKSPHLKIASASIDGVPVRFETTVAVEQEQPDLTAKISFEEITGKEWVNWVRVYIGGRGGGNVLFDYVVTAQDDSDDDGRNGHNRKGKAKGKARLDILLPTFSLPVGRLEVDVEINSSKTIFSFCSLHIKTRHFRFGSFVIAF
jgi:hypothetical protein